MGTDITQIATLDPKDERADELLSQFFTEMAVQMGLLDDPEQKRAYIPSVPSLHVLSFRPSPHLRDWCMFNNEQRYVFHVDVLDMTLEGLDIRQSYEKSLRYYRTFVFLADGTVHRHDGAILSVQDVSKYPNWAAALLEIFKILQGTVVLMMREITDVVENVRQEVLCYTERLSVKGSRP